MVAYSFKARFAEPILVGLGARRMHNVNPKQQTVRAIEKKRHARPGELVQLYTGLRTRSVRKLGEAVCTLTAAIKIEFPSIFAANIYIDDFSLTEDETHAFAHDDGFRTIDDFIEFWDDNHGIEKAFEGIIIYWEPKK